MNINDVLDGHVALDLDCLDRLYLNAYVPNVQVGSQVVRFLTQHLGNEVPSPVLFKRIGDRFPQAVAAFAQGQGIPLLHLKRPDRTRWDDRKLDHVRPHLEQAQRDGRYGVVAIVAAQEVQKVFMGYQRRKATHGKAIKLRLRQGRPGGDRLLLLRPWTSGHTCTPQNASLVRRCGASCAGLACRPSWNPTPGPGCCGKRYDRFVLSQPTVNEHTWMSEAFRTGVISMRVGVFVDPACLWSWQTSRWLVQVAPQRNLDIQWRSYSLLLRDGTQGLQEWEVTIRTASHPAVRVMEALRRDDPAAVPRFYEALLPRTFAAVNAGGPPFAELEDALVAAGLASTYAGAADDAAWDEPIRQSMAEAFAAAGGVVRTPAMVLYQDPPVGFLGPVVAAPPTGAEALRLWDALVALAAVPGVLEFSRPRPPHPEIPGLRLPQAVTE